ncbi:phage terminase small subunit P27 family [Thomasclavelia cocleata]|uniref:phage terminase small subunit P27 family n=1 Tax=Thomasclavelia cocleata TaxID=69824 RepID=UPI00242D0B4E|nr:phage terminase small subunit P27 family [Thomasclavelia cocleata]
MARPRQPVDLLIANDKKHLTKEEIEKRRASEIKPCTDKIEAPSYLTKKQKEEFCKIAEQLKKLNIMGETDIDALARYIISRDLYVNAVKRLRSKEIRENIKMYACYAKTQDRFFKQCRACAMDLGLTISSRCRLVVPAPPEQKKENKFSKFKKK